MGGGGWGEVDLAVGRPSSATQVSLGVIYRYRIGELSRIFAFSPLLSKSQLRGWLPPSCVCLGGALGCDSNEQEGLRYYDVL